MQARSVLRLALGMVSVIPGLSYAQGGCFVKCVSDICKISSGDSRATAHEVRCTEAGPQLEGGCMLRESEAALLSACRSLAVESGKVTVHVSVPGHAAVVQAAARTSLSTVLAKYPTLKCFSGETGCSSRAAIGGSAGRSFDPATSWEPYGDPCGMGLPCETVLLSSGNWRFRLWDGSQQGKLHLATTRGELHKQTASVESGTVELPAGWLQPAQTYRYQFVRSDGQLVAAGEFRTPSTRQQRAIDASLAEAAKQPAHLRKAALLESLLQDGLEWDALQLTLSEGGQ